METSTATPTPEDLLRKIQKLEEQHNRLQQLLNYKLQLQSQSKSKTSCDLLTETQYVNILDSMGQSVYMFDHNTRIVYWNHMSQILYGYPPAEALGKTAPDIIIEPKYSDLATIIIQRALNGEIWSGQFPVRTKSGDKFYVITTLAPCFDQYGTAFGATCVCADSRPFRASRPPSTLRVPQIVSSAQQPLQTAIVSKISDLASKVKLKMKTGETIMDHDTSDTNEGSENRPRLHKAFSWMGGKGVSWPWKGNENRDTSDIRPSRFGWPWLHNEEEQELGTQTSSSAPLELYESPINRKEAQGSSSSYSRGTSSSWSITSSSTTKTDIHIENLDVEISWDDLIIQEQIGEGSRGAVYHALLHGSDVAVKVFNMQECPDDMILSFRKEVRLMKRLRHPNILLFMGAVISPQYLCIVTEFLPRGSLFRLLQHRTTRLDWRRRVHMAMDIARGMNYLHRCKPPIIHRNLKSSNLLIDKNWSLKVGDFGLSRVKRGTYLTTTTNTGMPHWMAPEILRNEQVDEKSDVYSYGVVLWEITTRKIPWENLNSMQVIGAVGFMNRRLEMPNDVDPQWASLIESCWSREPRSRPTFEDILIELKDLQKKFSVQYKGS